MVVKVNVFFFYLNALSALGEKKLLTVTPLLHTHLSLTSNQHCARQAGLLPWRCQSKPVSRERGGRAEQPFSGSSRHEYALIKWLPMRALGRGVARRDSRGLQKRRIGAALCKTTAQSGYDMLFILNKKKLKALQSLKAPIQGSQIYSFFWSSTFVELKE